MMKQSTDVDEWLLSGTSETDICLRNNQSGKGLLERDEEEENMIMRKIEENQRKQAQAGTEKTYIIDDIDEELIYVTPIAAHSHGNLTDKAYIKGDRRVTTVVEQQTWEDLEDDYDEDQNEANIVKQYEQMKSSSSGAKTLCSFENSLNHSPALGMRDADAMIQSSEFRIEVKCSDDSYSRVSCHRIEECREEEDEQENLIDENEELVQSSDLRSYEQVAAS